jgi:hypothetical protein
MTPSYRSLTCPRFMTGQLFGQFFFVRIVVIFGELLIILREGAGTIDVRESRASIIDYVPFSWIFLHF